MDHARKRNAKKRVGGHKGERVEFCENDVLHVDDPLQMIALDEALSGLARVNERQARVVELRFLAGLTMEETAKALEVSRDTVKLDWRFARAWLNRQLLGG